MQLVDSLLQGIPVFYNSVATDVTYGEQGVDISTQDATFHGAPARAVATGLRSLCARLCFAGVWG